MTESIEMKNKDNAIYHTLKFIETGEKVHKEKAKASLVEISKLYKMNIRRNLPKKKTMPALLDFVLNEKGYLETINNLMAALR